jgi:hypothetical protein
MYVRVWDIEPFELFLDFRVCYAGTARTRLVRINRNKNGGLPAIGIEFTQDQGFQSKSGRLSTSRAFAPNVGHGPGQFCTGTSKSWLPCRFLCSCLSAARTYPLHVEPPNIFHDEALVHAIRNKLDANKRVAEVGISNNEYEVVRGKWCKLDVEQAVHGGSKFDKF